MANDSFSGEVPSLLWEEPLNLKGRVTVSQGAHPERKAWSETLYKTLWKEDNYKALMATQDIVKIIPNYQTNSKEQNVEALSNFFCLLSLCESSWNPNDPGGGLFQFSVDDARKNYHFTHLIHNVADVHNPNRNIIVAVGIITKLAREKKAIIIKGFFQPLWPSSNGNKSATGNQGKLAWILGQMHKFSLAQAKNTNDPLKGLAKNDSAKNGSPKIGKKIPS